MLIPTRRPVTERGGFYSKPEGYRMFDSRLWTDPVRTYLSKEKEIISWVISADQISSLFVVGCGPGFYSDLASRKQVEYHGLDVVPYDLENGTMFHNSAIEHFRPELAENISLDRKRLTVFPFNCLGNIDHALAALQNAKLFSNVILVSGFSPGASDERAEYYKACGNSGINITSEKEGSRITSAEGLNSIAYRSLFIERLAALCDLDLEFIESETVGSFILLRTDNR